MRHGVALEEMPYLFCLKFAAGFLQILKAVLFFSFNLLPKFPLENLSKDRSVV
jgi:hypothetical protein